MPSAPKAGAHPWDPALGRALHAARVLLMLPCVSPVAAVSSPQLAAGPQPTSSTGCGLLGKATLGLLGLRTEESGALGELRLSLVVVTVLNKPLLWSNSHGRAPFLLRVCHCRKCFVRHTLSAEVGLPACCQKTFGVSLEADT